MLPVLFCTSSCDYSHDKNLIFKGPPVFVKKIEHKQYGKQGKIFNMKLIVYSTSEIECYNVKSENKEITTSMRMTPINSTMVFHGTEVSVETIEIVLSFNTSIKRSRQNYTVTLCNGYSNSSFVIYITSVPVDLGNISFKAVHIQSIT